MLVGYPVGRILQQLHRYEPEPKSGQGKTLERREKVNHGP